MYAKTQVLAVGLLVAVATTPCAAQRGHEREHGQEYAAQGRARIVVFRESDHGAFRDYFRKHRAAYAPLPPGIQKKLMRGKPLPPGLARRRFPPDLIVVAPRLSRGYDYAIVGSTVIVLDTGGLVVDLLAVFP